MKFKINKLLVARLGIAHVINSRLMYNNLKSNEYAKSRSTILGKRALRHLLTFFLFVAGLIACIFWFIDCVHTGKILLCFIIIVPAIYLGVYSLMFLPIAFNLTIKQLRLNKKFIGYLDLIVLLTILFAIVGGIILLAIL